MVVATKSIAKIGLLIGIIAVLCLAGCSAKQMPMVKPAATPASISAIQPANVRIDFDANQILKSQVSGDAGALGRRVGADDPVRIASISKMVVAIAVMRMADQGTLDLDTDVSEYLGWQVRNPGFPDSKISMRMLLSHQSSLTDNADYILPLDGKLQTALANVKAWDSVHKPGNFFRYANFNFPLVAAVMEAAAKDRFDKLMARLVITPLGLDACYNWSVGCSDGRRAQAVTLLRPNGELARDAPLASGAMPCNFVPATGDKCDLDLYLIGQNGSAFGPQGGLRISANDLVKIGQMLLNNGEPLLSQKSFTEMTAVAWRKNGDNGDDEDGFFQAFGLGVHQIRDKDGREWIGHVGEAYSLRAGLWINLATGQGRVRYVTMVDEFAKVGHCFETCP
jgi:CubicO group peptidase (beta-lactamase class C family)